jgi:hypothetical protein
VAKTVAYFKQLMTTKRIDSRTIDASTSQVV